MRIGTEGNCYHTRVVGKIGIIKKWEAWREDPAELKLRSPMRVSLSRRRDFPGILASEEGHCWLVLTSLGRCHKFHPASAERNLQNGLHSFYKEVSLSRVKVPGEFKVTGTRQTRGPVSFLWSPVVPYTLQAKPSSDPTGHGLQRHGTEGRARN